MTAHIMKERRTQQKKSTYLAKLEEEEEDCEQILNNCNN